MSGVPAPEPESVLLLPNLSPRSAVHRQLAQQLTGLRDRLPTSPLRSTLDDVLSGATPLRDALHVGPLARLFADGARIMAEEMKSVDEADGDALRTQLANGGSDA